MFFQTSFCLLFPFEVVSLLMICYLLCFLFFALNILPYSLVNDLGRVLCQTCNPYMCSYITKTVRSMNCSLTLFDMKVISVHYISYYTPYMCYYTLAWTVWNVLCFDTFSCWHGYNELGAWDVKKLTKLTTHGFSLFKELKIY